MEKRVKPINEIKGLDVVYVIKDAIYNEELRYSLRSLEKNFKGINKVWFYGGKPMYFHPDKQVIVNQKGPTKWDNVRNMMRSIAENDDITEDFVLFNDDFFVMKPVETLPAYRYKTIESLCEWVEKQRNLNHPSSYTNNLRDVAEELKEAGLPTYNFALHLPIIINRKKLLEVLERFPNTKSPRSVYGNAYLVDGAVVRKDVKIFRSQDMPPEDTDYISTEDYVFANGRVGKMIRAKFPDKSRWER